MARDPRYDILFEPVRIGPVTARNRFYQVPHCNGMGHTRPRMLAAMRGIKAEGGWAVVCTEEVEIHPSSDASPAREGRLWDDRDLPALELMTEAVHAHGSLAGIELFHGGINSANRMSRMVSLGPSSRPVRTFDPIQVRAMDRHDIRALRRWHRAAALRAKRAGFDVIYVYAAHDLSVLMHFLSRRRNERTDEYGGKLENRVRLLREIIEDTKEAVGDRSAVAVRLAVDELLGAEGITAEAEGHDIVAMLADLPDLWDVNVSDWANDSAVSRFAEEGYQERHIAFVKQLTSKPVVGVGRFTSPDAMVSQIRGGILDFIGAARPSIADPFLPRKIEEGRIDEIRECIGCNICVSGDMTQVPMRCTQNPTMGEEWRRGWHPEIIPAKRTDEAILVVGAGPAGLECARALGQRGFDVHLAEAGTELGGRVTAEARLPGLAAWARVRDHRVQRIAAMPNVQVYRDSRLSADHVREFGMPHVVIATGARWRRDGVGRWHGIAPSGLDPSRVLTPDDVLAGAAVPGPVVVFDDDHFYLGGVIAEKLRRDGLEVTLVTPAAQVSAWTVNTLEQRMIYRRLIELDVELVTGHAVTAQRDANVELACAFTGRASCRPCGSLVALTARLPVDDLYLSLTADPDSLAASGIRTVSRIGDCEAPATIAAAVHAGHRFAREFGEGSTDEVPFRRDVEMFGAG
ncbi:MAG: NADH:flavin oxidoreductase [Alphaproteobacteria bacterium]|nr:NADH:flavin oxidoreductase [Alphaproteobacteria bacterium]